MVVHIFGSSDKIFTKLNIVIEKICVILDFALLQLLQFFDILVSLFFGANASAIYAFFLSKLFSFVWTMLIKKNSFPCLGEKENKYVLLNNIFLIAPYLALDVVLLLVHLSSLVHLFTLDNNIFLIAPYLALVLVLVLVN